MKALTHLTVPAVSLALLVSGCGQVAPIAPTESEVVLQQENRGALRPTPGLALAHGHCCPDGFDQISEIGNPADHNGDTIICRKVTLGTTVTIDNNGPGGCDIPCIPPC